MKLSIITVNRNNAAGLDQTIQSVIKQTFRDFEYIIIDGASTDQSVEVIKKYSANISYWVSEKDSGIYNAMNKGIRRASGEYLFFLNSGDYLVDNDSLQKVFSLDYSEDLLYGDLFFKKGEVTYRKNSPRMLSASFLLYGTLPHPATFIKRKLFEIIGEYDEGIKISADHDFFQKAILKLSCTYRHIDEPISVFLLDGISNDITNRDLIRKEHHNSFKNNFPLFFDEYMELLEFRNDTLISFVKENRQNSILIICIKIIRKFKKLISIRKIK